MLNGNRQDSQSGAQAPLRWPKSLVRPFRLLAATALLLATAAAWAQAAPVPTVSVTSVEDLLGSIVTLQAGFTNGATDDALVGYGPYLDVFLPSPPDPLRFQGATYLGQPLRSDLVTLDASGQATHPFALDAAGQPVQLSGAPDGRVAVLTLPFGSVTVGQPSLDIDIQLALSAQAAPGTPIDIDVVPGFRYGSDPLNNPATDLPLRGSHATGSVTPELVRFTKRLIAPEGDTPVGESFTHRYVLELLLAPEQTLDNVVLTDVLPNALVIRGGTLQVTVDGAPAPHSADFTVAQSGTNPGAQPVQFPDSDTGPFAQSSFSVMLHSPVSTVGAGPATVQVGFDFFIPSVDANGAQAGAPASGNQHENLGSYYAEWPGNLGAPGGPLAGQDSALVTITNDSSHHPVDANGTIRLQKWVGGSGSKHQTVRPGDTVSYYLDFQVSDVSAFGGVSITDVLADGLEYVNGSMQLDSYVGPATALHPGPLAPTYAVEPDGSSTLEVQLGELVGACVIDGFRGLDEDCLASAAAPTHGTISYQARVLNQYRQDDSAGQSRNVVQNDDIANTATIRGQILDVMTGAGTDRYDSDPGSANVTVAGLGTTKAIAFINDEEVSATGPVPSVSNGDRVTFRLQVDLGALAFKDLVVTDFLPLPVFAAPASMQFVSCGEDEAPAVNQVCYAPGSTFASDITTAGAGGYDPSARTITTHAGSNSFTVHFGDYAPAAGEVGSSTIVLYATLEVADTALADDLFITNMLQASDYNSASAQSVDQNAVQLRYTRPDLNISNGVINVSNGSAYSGTDLPVPVGPTLVSGSGAGQRADPNYDLDVAGLDADDIVTVLVVVENIGHGKAGAFDLVLREELPAGLAASDVVPGSLTAVLGTGQELVLPSGAQADLFSATGLALQGPVLARGMQEDATSVTSDGSNILYLTYQVRLPATSESGTAFTTVSEVVSFAALSGGANLTAPGLVTDDVTVALIPPAVTKSVSATSEGAGSRVTVGEIVRYRLQVSVPEGHTTDLVLTDALPAGLTYLPASGVRIAAVSRNVGEVRLLDAASAWLTPPSSTTAPALLNDGNSALLPGGRVSINADTLTLQLGNAVNAASNAEPEQLIVEFNALVTNTPTNSIGDGNSARDKSNSFTAAHGPAGQRRSVTSAPTVVRLFEPRLTIVKEVSPGSDLDAGDSLLFTIRLMNQATDSAMAFDVELRDELPPHVVFDSYFVTSMDAPGTTHTEVDGTVSVTAAALRPGGSITLDIRATLARSLPSGATLSNSASYVASGLPGPNGTVDNDTGAHPPGAPGEADGERQYRGTADVSFTSRALQPTKSVVDTSESHTAASQLTIGEVVRYRLAVTIPEGVNDDLTLVDELPAGLVLADPAMATLSLVGTGLTVAPELSGNVMHTVCQTPVAAPTVALPPTLVRQEQQTVSFLLGDITNENIDDSQACALLEFNAVVRDVPGNIAGVTLTNRFHASANGSSGPTATAAITLVEPSLTLAKSVDGAAQTGSLDAGDQVTYTLQVGHAAGSTAAAYDLLLTDQLPLQLDPASLTAEVQPVGLGAVGITDGLLSVTAMELTPNQTLTITVRGTLIAGLNPGTDVHNRADLWWTGLPGEGTRTGQPSNYTGTDSGPERSYGPVTDDVRFTTHDLSLTKAVSTTSEGHTSGNDVVVGEVIRYRLSVELPEGIIPDLQVLDALPSGLAALPGAGVRAALVASGNHVTAASLTGAPVYLDGSLPAVLEDGNSLLLPGATFSAGQVQIDLGDVTNLAGMAGDERLILEFNAVVVDAPGNVDSWQLTNSARVLSGGRQRDTDSATVTVREPRLSIVKAVMGGSSDWSSVQGGSLSNADIGETVTFQVTLTNAAGAVAAQAVALSDLIPAELQLTAVEVTLPDGSTYSPAVGNELDLTLGALNPGGTLQVRYEALILGSAGHGASITNTAGFSAVSTQPDNDDNPTGSASGTPRTYEGDASASTAMARPRIGLAKLVSDQPTTSDDGIYDLSFTFVAQNLGLIQLDGVQVTDDLATTFPPTSGISVISATVGSVMVDGVELPGAGNPNFNRSVSGVLDTDLLVPGAVSLLPDQQAVVVLDLVVQLADQDALGAYQNSATATGATPGGIPAPPAPSASGNDPQGTPSSTPVTFTETPGVSLTKQFLADELVAHHDGSFTIRYRLTAGNTGQVPLRGLQIEDDLAGVYGTGGTVSGVTVAVEGADPTLVANGGYDGINDVDLLDANRSWLAAGVSQSLLLTVTVAPAHTGVSYSNGAHVTGTSPLGQTSTASAIDSNSFSAAPQLLIGTCVAGVHSTGTLGQFTVLLTVRVHNQGDLQLNGAQALLDLDAIFAEADSYQLDGVTQSGGGTVAPNPGFGTAANWNLLPEATTLFTAQQTGADFAQYDLTLTVVPGNQLTYALAGSASGQAPVHGSAETGLVTASATDWCDPARPPGPDPSPLSFDDEPALGVAKRFAGLQGVPGSPGQFDVEFEFVLRNYGYGQLNDLSLTDDFNAAFADGSAWEVTHVSATGTLAAAPLPLSGTQLLAPGSYLGSQGQATSQGSVTVRLRVTPQDPSSTYFNSASASGTNPDGVPVSDSSVDGDDPDPDGDGDPTNDDEDTPFTFESPLLGVAKDVPALFDFGAALGADPAAGLVSNPHNVGDGSYLVAFRLTLTNYGDVPLSDLLLTDDLLTQLADANPISVRAVNGSLSAAASYDGTAGSNMLADGQSLAVDQTGTVHAVVTLRPGTALASGSLQLQNRALAQGTSPGGQDVTDDSNTGTDPDSGQPNDDDPSNDGDGDPTNNDGPTSVTLTEAPGVALAKSLTLSQNLGTGRYRVGFSLSVANVGDVDLSSVQVTDDLVSAFRGVDVQIESLTATAPLAANADLADALTSGGLLDASLSSLPVGAGGTIELVVLVTPGAEVHGAPFQNSAEASGDSPAGARVTDISNDGEQPDPDDDSSTPIQLDEAPLLGVAKSVPATFDFGGGQVANPSNLQDGTYQVAYLLTLVNHGDVVLTDLRLTDDLLTQLADANPISVSAVNGSLGASAGYDGAPGSNILADGQSLAVQQTGTVHVVVTLQPGAALRSGSLSLENQASAQGTSPGQLVVADDSNAGTDPDNGQPDGDDPANDGDDDPTNNAGPTNVTLTEEPLIGLAKQVVQWENLGTGSYRVRYSFVVQNQGDVNLSQVQVTDRLTDTFRGSDFQILALAATGPLTPATLADAQASGQLLDAAASSLLVGESGTLDLLLEVQPRAHIHAGPFLNSASASGTSPSGAQPTDVSNDGTSPDRQDDTPTPLQLTERPSLGVAKRASVSPVGDGRFDVLFDFTLTNHGDIELRELQLTDDLDQAFGAGNHRALSLYSPTLSVNHVAPDPDNPAAYDGAANQNLLQGVDTLARGASATVQLRVRVTPAHMGAHQNQALGHATSPGELTVTDRSTDGLDPDPDGNDVPDEETPTPVTFDETPLIGLAKRADVSMNDDGSFDVTLTFTVRNMGDVPLRGVRISDPLDGIYAITDLTPDRIFVQSSTLTVNANYDGRDDDQVLLGSDTLAVGAQRQVTVRLEGIRPTSGASTTNSAVASGSSPNGTPTQDRSTDGDEPDPDGDGTPAEQVPTPIQLTSSVQVALAKSSSLTVAADGSYDITFTLTVANVGNTTLHGLQVRDDLADYYANTDLTPARVSVTSSRFSVSGGYDGATDSRLLAGADSLPVGASGTIQVSLSGVTPNVAGATLMNSAVANAVGPDGTPTNDRSNDGVAPQAGVDVPTSTPLSARPLLGVAKQAAVIQLADGSYTVTFDLVLRNYGNADLVDVSLTDDLAAFYAGAGLQSANVTLASADLPVNPAYDGRTDTQLLGAGAQLAVGATGAVQLRLSGLSVVAQTSFTNQAEGGGRTRSGQPTPPERSTDGADPDPDGNGDPTDDSVPTPVQLSPRPLLGVAKEAAVVQNADGSYRLQFTLRLTNMGGSHLRNLSLVDDLADFYHHTDLIAANVTVTSADLPINAGYDGQGDTELLAAGAELALGQTAALLLTLDQVRPVSGTSFLNSAQGSGASPDGTPTTDDSQDGSQPDPDGDGDPGNDDDPTPVVLQPIPRSGLAKRATTLANGDGTFDITFDFVLGNYGNTVLQGLQVRDDLSVLYDLTDLAAAHIAVTSPDFATNPGYDGLTDPRLLAAGNSLAVGGSGTIRLSISGVTLNAPVDTYNTAIATGAAPDGTPGLPDSSTNGDDPDPDGDGDPGNDSEPTPVRLGQAPRIGLAKSARVQRDGDGSYDITFALLVRNYGDAPLAQLSLADDLTAFYSGSNLSPERVSLSSDDLLTNPAYDGRGEVQLLAAGNRLGVGEAATLSIHLSGVVPNAGVTRLDNLALAHGTAPDGTEVADTSTDGNDPDPDGRGPQSHSQPTPVRFEAEAAVLLTKQVDEGPYAIGDRVRYTVTIINPNDVATAFDLTDKLPAGTAFVEGTAAFHPANLAPADGSQPRQDQPGTLDWHGVVVPAGAQLRVTYELRILPGAGDTLLNQVWVEGLTGFGAPVTAQASAVARVTQGVFEVGAGALIGRVYFDVDRDDTYQEGVDLPIAGARVLLSNGWQTLTDQQGNYAFRDLSAGSWTVMVDRVTAPYRPSDHPQQLRDQRQHLVDVRGLTVTDFPFQLPQGLAAAARQTVVSFGPITVSKSLLQLEDGLRAVLEIDFGDAHDQGWPALFIHDPVPDEQPRTFVVEPSASPTVLSYDLPLGTPLTDPELLWSDR